MARWWDQNRSVFAEQTCAFMHAFKAQALVAGWTILQAGDGATFWKAGVDVPPDPISSGAALYHKDAWFLLQMPDGNRKLMVARCNVVGHTSFYLGYAASGSYADGSAATPAAVNTAVESAIWGTYGVTRTAENFGYDSGNYTLQLMFNDTAPYDFYGFINRAGTGYVYTAIHGEEVYAPDPGDADPFVIAAKYNTNGVFGWGQLGTAPTANSDIYGCRGYVNGIWSGFSYCGWCNSTSFQNTIVPVGQNLNAAGANPWDTKDDVFRPIIARVNKYGNPSYKGMSNLFRYSPVVRAGGDLLSVDATGDWITYQDCRIPWNNEPPTM